MAMLSIGYDGIAVEAGGTRVVVDNRPAQPRRIRHYLITLWLLQQPERFTLAPAEALCRSGTPFVYPLELHSLFLRSFWHEARGDVPDLGTTVPRHVVDAARAGRARILLSYAHEGGLRLEFPARDGRPLWFFDTVQDFVERHDLPGEAVWFLNGDLDSSVAFETWRARRGVDPANSFRFRAILLTPGIWQATTRLAERGREICYAAESIAASTFTQRPLAGSLDHRQVRPEVVRDELGRGAVRPKTFLCMNYAVERRSHRQLVASFLVAHDLDRNGLLSFPEAPIGLNRLLESERVSDEIKQGWRRLHARLPLIIDTDRPDHPLHGAGGAVNMQWQSEAWPYRSSYVNFVTESWFLNRTCFITEKTFRAMIQCQPFVVVGTHGSLGHLRARGFRTFHGLIDERYDAIKDDFARMEAVLETIGGLAALTPGRARDLYAAALDQMWHNRDRLLDGTSDLDLVFAELAFPPTAAPIPT